LKIFCLDFETYYSQTFSLSKITTEEYVRSPEFETIGVAVCEQGSAPTWFSGTKADTKEFLDSFELDKHLVIAHNAIFDMAILNWQFDIRPKGIADTLSMARAIHGTEVGVSLAKLAEHYELGVKGTEVLQAQGKRRIDFNAQDLAQYGEYCKNDVVLTMGLFEKLSAGFPPSELRLIDLTIRMFSEPSLWLDGDILHNHLDIIRERKAELTKIYPKEDLMSNDKFAVLLSNFNIEPPRKISATTGKEAWAFAKTDEGFKELLEHFDANVQILATARLGVKSTIEETRTERFIEIAQRGLFPIPLRYYAAHTGRWGGDDKVNLQNLPRGSILKNAIMAPPGHVVVDSDSSQIEARTLAWLAEQNDLVDAFERGEDVYRIMASSIYNKATEEISKDERFVGKTTILGAGYGMGAQKFKAQLKTFNVEVSDEETAHIIKVYRETYDWIPALWRKAGLALDAIINNQSMSLGRAGVLEVEGRRGIRLPNGLYMKYPNLRKMRNEQGKDEYVYDTKKGKAVVPNRIYGGKVIENVCQALARIIIGEQMLQVAKKYKVVMTVHDAIACVIPEQEAEVGQEYVEMCMKMRPKWAQDLPLSCESGIGRSYGDC
jgi:DNA polymerase I-like protein with 3'-5' exonuclease and polymerase domains|tara:strand:+ start:4033 stop:5850 length:1818 start_codon:yes stop_codon:yes gene_type:complete